MHIFSVVGMAVQCAYCFDCNEPMMKYKQSTRLKRKKWASTMFKDMACFCSKGGISSLETQGSNS